MAYDEEFDKQFLLCDYNRDGDSYRLDLPSLSAWNRSHLKFAWSGLICEVYLQCWWCVTCFAVLYNFLRLISRGFDQFCHPNVQIAMVKQVSAGIGGWCAAISRIEEIGTGGQWAFLHISWPVRFQAPDPLSLWRMILYITLWWSLLIKKNLYCLPSLCSNIDLGELDGDNAYIRSWIARL